jgi:hypothetical protein
MTFNEYIASQKAGDNPRGDFISDTRDEMRAGRMPEIASWDQLENYLLGKRACSEALTEGGKLWREYERAQAKA